MGTRRLTDITDEIEKIEIDIADDDTTTVVLTNAKGTMTVRGSCEVVEVERSSAEEEDPEMPRPLRPGERCGRAEHPREYAHEFKRFRSAGASQCKYVEPATPECDCDYLSVKYVIQRPKGGKHFSDCATQRRPGG
jgi:hypothetical protein